ncbi:hypothetical protein VRU48_06675 [Pedobacter sp. KR3-3]|uniref:GAPS4 PD-(D/E)XK nuclease domain-containing protein n=1 Tax=Pedobacter albus TaxID=3113905 RepID=A0ABU7I5R5_9SPHI|nr:hypothetical protein [Pedobacter sp. KR3-3]MEE1944783.1 hypothetical protein [Pedobacter sp. KR3-3]
MPEDQAVNGDRWNGQFTKLLESIGWTSLGDANMDLTNEVDEQHGVDRLFTFVNSFIDGREEAVIFEAKNYLTTSYNSGHIDTWIKTLDKKISNLKNSERLYEMFPSLQSMPFRTGVIAIWFSDLDNYPSFRQKFIDSLAKVKLNRQQGDSNHIYVLDNSGVLRLASLFMAIDEINRHKDTKDPFQFYFPAAGKRQAVNHSAVLALNYFPAKFILGQYTDVNHVEHRVVFYLGRLDIASFERLQNALSNIGFLDTQKPLTIFTYQRDDNFYRKIKPELENIFAGLTIDAQEMEYITQLPRFMRKD